MGRRITQDICDKFIAKYKNEQQDLVSKMENHRKADESYYYGASKLLELSQRAWELFKNSQPDRKNELLKYLLANAEMDEKKLIPTLNKPFDVIYSCNKSNNWLPIQNFIRSLLPVFADITT